MRNKHEYNVVSRNAFSKLRLTQFIFFIMMIIGIIGTVNSQNAIFVIMFLLSAGGLIVIRILRWMHRD